MIPNQFIFRAIEYRKTKTKTFFGVRMRSLTLGTWCIQQVRLQPSPVNGRADENVGKIIKEVNKIPKRFCRQNGRGFIYRDNIAANQHLDRSQLHLNKTGTSLFSQNFNSFINVQQEFAVEPKDIESSVKFNDFIKAQLSLPQV